MLVDLDDYRARVMQLASRRAPPASTSPALASARLRRADPSTSTTHDDLIAALVFVPFLPGLWEVSEDEAGSGGGNAPFRFLLIEPIAQRGSRPRFRLDRKAGAVDVMVHEADDENVEWRSLERGVSISVALALVRQRIIRWYRIDRVQGR
jgi:hypothetical protein